MSQTLATRLTTVAKTAASPLTWAGQKAYARSTVATRFYPTELQQQISDARATGEDLAVDCTKTYVQMQWNLIPYRILKLKDEIDAITSGTQVSLSSFTYKDWVRNARFLVRLLFIFMFGVMTGRLSIYPLIGPNSIFAEELLKRPTGL